MQKKAFLTRVGCLLLSLALLCPFAGCTGEPNPSYLENNLTVEAVQVIYTADFITEASARITALYCRLLPQMGGPTLTDTERDAVQTDVRERAMPTFLRAGVTEQELTALLTYAEGYEQALAGSEGDALTAYCHLYTKCAALLGHKRAGKLLYDITVQYLSHQITLNEQRYMEYGYEFYREDAMRYRTRLTALYNDLGAETFAHATRVFVLLLTFLGVAAPAEQSEDPLALIYDGEVLQILRMQADEFAALPVTAAQWELMGTLYAGLTPKNLNTPLQAERAALQESGLGAALLAQMPALLALYRKMLYSMSEADVATLRRDTSEQARTDAVCHALNACESELNVLLDGFEQTAAGSDGSAERRAMQRVGALDACEQFLTETPTADRAMLLAAIAAGEDSVRQTALAYLRGQMPYLAFAITYKEG